MCRLACTIAGAAQRTERAALPTDAGREATFRVGALGLLIGEVVVVLFVVVVVVVVFGGGVGLDMPWSRMTLITIWPFTVAAPASTILPSDWIAAPFAPPGGLLTRAIPPLPKSEAMLPLAFI